MRENEPFWKTNNIKFISIIIIKISFIKIHLYLSMLTDNKEIRRILFKSHWRNNGLFRLIYRTIDYFKSFILLGTNSFIHKVIYLFFSLKVVPGGDYIQALNDFSLLYLLHSHQKRLTLLFSTLFVWKYSFLLDLSIVFNFVGHKGDIKISTYRWFAAGLRELHLLTVSNPLP